jgi:long-chain fatty acid transport protein
MRFALKHAALAAACMAAFPVQATNGLQMPGFGNRATGMGGVGIAYGRDSLSQAANPANIVNTGMRGDMGVAIFNAERRACTGVDTGLIPSVEFGGQTFYPPWFTSLGFDGCSESDSKYYVMPEMGMTMPLTEQLHVGMAFVPFGGGGTSYPYNFFSWETGASNFPSPDAKLGVDLMILQAPVTVAYKVNDNHAVGASVRGSNLATWASFWMTDSPWGWSTTPEPI